MRTEKAEHLLHKRVDSGCSDLIYLGRPHADLTIEFNGERSERSPARLPSPSSAAMSKRSRSTVRAASSVSSIACEG